MISLWIAKFKGYLIAAAGIIAAIVTFGYSMKREGKQEAKNEGNKQAIENVKKVKEAEADADKVDDIDAALRDNGWMRD